MVKLLASSEWDGGYVTNLATTKILTIDYQKKKHKNFTIENFLQTYVFLVKNKNKITSN